MKRIFGTRRPLDADLSQPACHLVESEEADWRNSVGLLQRTLFPGHWGLRAGRSEEIGPKPFWGELSLRHGHDSVKAALSVPEEEGEPRQIQRARACSCPTRVPSGTNLWKTDSPKLLNRQPIKRMMDKGCGPTGSLVFGQELSSALSRNQEVANTKRTTAAAFRGPLAVILRRYRRRVAFPQVVTGNPWLPPAKSRRPSDARYF